MRRGQKSKNAQWRDWRFVIFRPQVDRNNDSSAYVRGGLSLFIP